MVKIQVHPNPNKGYKQKRGHFSFSLMTYLQENCEKEISNEFNFQSKFDAVLIFAFD